MHEMSLLHDVVDIVLDEVKDMDIVSVKRVVLAIGDLRDVVGDYVPSLFERLTRGTVAQGAEIQIIHVPVTARCRGCGFVLPVDVRDEATWTCPGCGAHKNFHITTGNEFIVQSIEVEMASEESGGEQELADRVA